MTERNAPAPPAVVVFDLGNVVLDWDFERMLGALDCDPAERDLLRRELFAHPDWMALDAGLLAETQVIERIRRQTSLRAATVEAALEAARNSLTPIPETLRLMADIVARGTRLLCLSNMSRETYGRVRDYDFFAWFDGIVISAIEGCVKPDEAIFRLLIERYRLQPESTLFIDDSAANVAAAERLGIAGFHFRRTPACYAGLRARILAEAPPGKASEIC